jgi:hypothetical protein
MKSSVRLSAQDDDHEADLDAQRCGSVQEGEI